MPINFQCGCENHTVLGRFLPLLFRLPCDDNYTLQSQKEKQNYFISFSVCRMKSPFFARPTWNKFLPMNNPNNCDGVNSHQLCLRRTKIELNHRFILYSVLLFMDMRSIGSCVAIRWNSVLWSTQSCACQPIEKKNRTNVWGHCVRAKWNTASI